MSGAARERRRRPTGGLHVTHARNVVPVLVLFAALQPGALRAAGSVDVLPTSVSSYATSDHAARVPLAVASAPALEYSFDPETVMDAPAASSGQSYWPVLFSALIPGAGEISMGYYKRGIALVVAEAVAWTGYSVNHSNGTDKRTEYEAFADAHWSEDKWILDHPCNVEQIGDGQRNLENLELCGQAGSGSDVWPGYIPFVPKSKDKQHYYENLGKYDWYISGWEDWNPAAIPYAHDTTLRTEYRQMRIQSNTELDHADAFIWVSVAARAFSLVETAILVHNRRGEPAGAGGGQIALRARARGWDGGELALEVGFK
jgi:hypothetical protein